MKSRQGLSPGYGEREPFFDFMDKAGCRVRRVFRDESPYHENNALYCRSVILLARWIDLANMEFGKVGWFWSVGRVIRLRKEPHGGVLVSADADPDLVERARGGALPEILVDEMALCDLQNICDGTYSPIDGFMTSAELNGVLNEHRLADGTVWTLPIVLPVPSDRLSQLAPGNLAVIRGPNNQAHSIIDISEIYESSAKTWASAWFGTTDEEHPGLKSLVGRGGHFVAGKVHLIRQDQPLYPAWQLSPTATRSIFHQKGWNRVVGFHSRNVPHQVHVHLQLEALRETGADGVLINPVVGFKKAGDFLSDVIMDGYDALLKASVYRVVPQEHGLQPLYRRPRSHGRHELL
jgi:ATP sulfurylase